MSSRFVSGGTISSSGEISKEAPSAPSAATTQPAKSKEWEVVQQELEAERKRREEARVKAAAGDERSLYDILQANKAAKQAAFEEQNKIRNQFRALDDDEIDFLDEVREKKRNEERMARRELEEGLKAFRDRRKDESTTVEENEGADGEEWGVGRKRKRVKERDVKGVRRRVSEAKEENGEKGVVEDVKLSEEKTETKEDQKKTSAPASAPAEKKSLGLVGYGSDSDDDD